MAKVKSKIETIFDQTIHDQSNDRGGVMIRVVGYSIDGVPRKPLLEKRRYVKIKEGTKLAYSKRCGLSSEDLNVINEKWEDIAAIFRDYKNRNGLN